jgi:hypothetical protein
MLLALFLGEFRVQRRSAMNKLRNPAVQRTRIIATDGSHFWPRFPEFGSIKPNLDQIHAQRARPMKISPAYRYGYAGPTR